MIGADLQNVQVWLATTPVDVRKSFDSLAELVRSGSPVPAPAIAPNLRRLPARCDQVFEAQLPVLGRSREVPTPATTA